MEVNFELIIIALIILGCIYFLKEIKNLGSNVTEGLKYGKKAIDLAKRYSSNKRNSNK